MVRILNAICLVFKQNLVEPNHAKTGLKCPVFEWLQLLNLDMNYVRYSDESGIWVSGIWMVTVFRINRLVNNTYHTNVEKKNQRQLNVFKVGLHYYKRLGDGMVLTAKGIKNPLVEHLKAQLKAQLLIAAFFVVY